MICDDWKNCDDDWNDYGISCDKYGYHPCEHIDDVMEELNISERNEENDKKIRDYLFDNCCNKRRNMFYKLKYRIIKIFKKLIHNLFK